MKTSFEEDSSSGSSDNEFTVPEFISFNNQNYLKVEQGEMGTTPANRTHQIATTNLKICTAFIFFYKARVFNNEQDCVALYHYDNSLTELYEGEDNAEILKHTERLLESVNTLFSHLLRSKFTTIIELKTLILIGGNEQPWCLNLEKGIKLIKEQMPNHPIASKISLILTPINPKMVSDEVSKYKEDVPTWCNSFIKIENNNEIIEALVALGASDANKGIELGLVYYRINVTTQVVNEYFYQNEIEKAIENCLLDEDDKLQISYLAKNIIALREKFTGYQLETNDDFVQQLLERIKPREDNFLVAASNTVNTPPQAHAKLTVGIQHTLLASKRKRDDYEKRSFSQDNQTDTPTSPTRTDNAETQGDEDARQLKIFKKTQ
jgi:hypothetical protein